jgi:uncharacterized membrane protein
MRIYRTDADLKAMATLLVFVLSLSASFAQFPNKIKVLYHGDALDEDWTSLLLYSDPMLDVTRVPSHAWRDDYDTEKIKKFMRLYMPRRYEEFVRFGLIILSDSSRAVFTSKELTWFHQGVTRDGVSLTMIGGYDSFGGSRGAPGWGGTTVEEILPVTLTNLDTEFSEMRMRIQEEGNPLMKILGPMNPPPYLGMNLVQTRPGAQLLATGASVGEEHPLMVSWDPGGRVFAMTADWNGGWGEYFLTWPSYPTYASVMTYYAAGVDQLPEDLTLFEVFRNLFHEYPTRRALATGLLEFVEKFGASTSSILMQISEIDEMKREAETLFLSQEYSEALRKLGEVNERLRLLSQDLVSLKQRALLWVYAIEWLAVCGTVMICGSTLWALMIRRRLYKEVGVTSWRA